MDERANNPGTVAPVKPAPPWAFASEWRPFATLCLILVVVMGTMAFLVSAQVRRSLEVQATERNAAVARLVAQGVDEHFQGLMSYVESYARRRSLVNLIERNDTEGVRAHLKDLVTQNAGLHRAVITDPNGILRYDYPPAPEVIGKDFSFRDWYKGVSTTQRTYVSEIYKRAAPPSLYLVALATPIRNAQGKTLGYLAGQHTIERLTGWLAGIELSPVRSIALIDHRAMLMMKGRDGGGEGLIDLAGHPLGQKALAGEVGSATARDPVTGEQSLISYRPIVRIGWGVLSIQPVAAVLAPITALQRTIATLVVACFVVMLGLGFFWLNTIRRYHHALFESDRAKDRYVAELDRTVTQLKRVEEAVRRTNESLQREIAAHARAEVEITQTNRDLQTLLYVTSHDLREPLRAIESFSRMVHDRYADRLDENGQDFLRRVVRAVQRMNRLLDDVLTLSRAQRIERPIEAVEAEACVREALRRLEARIQETGAKVLVTTDLPRLRVDSIWATQAVYNLIANALKFTRPGEPPEVEIAGYQVNDETGIVVRDRGPGVAPEHAERIFGLFQRAVGREVEGTGAGLAIVRQVAERHEGRAWVQPREGGGSEFVITFGKSDAKGGG